LLDMFERVLIASDLSPTSDAALDTGLALARANGRGEAVVLYVLELWLASRSWIATPTPQELEVHQRFLAREESAIAERLRELLKSRITADGQPTVRILVRDGHAADIIAAVANEMSSGVIVMGTKGRPDTLGSVAERVVRVARRPVLVVPA
jgi:nucleotide-binding universal stress UspA family protein